MKNIFAAFTLVVALSSNSGAEESFNNTVGAMTPRECVLARPADDSGNETWQECITSLQNLTISAGIFERPKGLLPKPKFFWWHGPWGKSVVDYLASGVGVDD